MDSIVASAPTSPKSDSVAVPDLATSAEGFLGKPEVATLPAIVAACPPPAIPPEFSRAKRENATPLATGDEPYLTKREAARLLRKSTRTLDQWMAARLVSYIKIGRSVLFRRADIDAALDKFRVK